MTGARKGEPTPLRTRTHHHQQQASVAAVCGLHARVCGLAMPPETSTARTSCTLTVGAVEEGVDGLWLVRHRSVPGRAVRVPVNVTNIDVPGTTPHPATHRQYHRQPGTRKTITTVSTSSKWGPRSDRIQL